MTLATETVIPNELREAMIEVIYSARSLAYRHMNVGRTETRCRLCDREASPESGSGHKDTCPITRFYKAADALGRMVR